jgi:hypothetical protein
MLETILAGSGDPVGRAAADLARAMGLSVEDDRLERAAPASGEEEHRRALERQVRTADAVWFLGRAADLHQAEELARLAAAHRRPFLALDLEALPRFELARRGADWLAAQGGRRLLIAGPRNPAGADLEQRVRELLHTVWHLSQIPPAPPRETPAAVPATLDQAVAMILERLPLQRRVALARLETRDPRRIRDSLPVRVVEELHAWLAHPGLQQACGLSPHGPYRERRQGVEAVCRRLQEHLRRTHRLRRVR